MGKKIIIDTNIYISALGWGGKPKQILNKIIDGEYELILSINQLEEIKRVLNYPKLGFTEEQKERFLLLLYQIATIVRTESELDIIVRDSKDIIILQPAKEIKIDYIITGDEDLLILKEFNGAKIIDPTTFLEKTRLDLADS